MRVLGRLLLTLGYFVIVTPVAILRRLLGGNPLRHSDGDMGYWIPHKEDRSANMVMSGRPKRGSADSQGA